MTIPRTNKCTILIVEDNQEILNPLVEYFEQDYDVVTAGNGRDAILVIKSLKELPCIVFLDLMMPIMNGWEFLSHVEKHGLLPGVQIVVVSAGNPKTIPKGILFVVKPFKLDELEKCCVTSCEKKAGRDGQVNE